MHKRQTLSGQPTHYGSRLSWRRVRSTGGRSSRHSFSGPLQSNGEGNWLLQGQDGSANNSNHSRPSSTAKVIVQDGSSRWKMAFLLYLVLTPARSSSLVPGGLSINPWLVDLGEPVSASGISSRNRGSLASHPHGLPRLPGWHWAEMSSSGEMRLSFPAASSWPLFDLLTIAACYPRRFSKW
ncbi:hypothetical protein BO86DRAFT_390676 [Aspergillus japonicus CBS 114.51]|uniref:Uncharacterized protein n=1 Tax=Aspergillus japonicus CBS 114.51 TaxID=1448312 RepID=A0A8T8WVQ0_ASPJA|nr:hypothetical protein BO86DRAFT_390676 [Aspergillus japonicus CBS 114.51]RAH79903.1 hypothetical protein BO86DRAFT_390676 [Aspergillus japonicus CBS 114.51]